MKPYHLFFAVFICVYYKFTIEKDQRNYAPISAKHYQRHFWNSRKVHPMGLTSLIKILLPSNTKHPLEFG